MIVGVPFSGCKYQSEVPVTREDEAIGFAVGVILGGGECSVYMQNDGFLQSLNIICTLLKPYDIKVPIEIKIRHTPEHHAFAGKIMPDIMRILGYEEKT